MRTSFDLTGQVAFVTGASSGLGAHFAQTLSDAGAKVVVGARRADRLKDLSERITQSGGTALAVDLDVTDANSIAQAVARAEDEAGPISILVNNAGIPPRALSLEMDEAEWDSVMALNQQFNDCEFQICMCVISLVGPGSVGGVSG